MRSRTARPIVSAAVGLLVAFAAPAEAEVDGPSAATTPKTVDEDASVKDLSELSLEELLNLQIKVSVASQTEESIINASGTVYVIDEDEIRRYGWLNLREILAAIPNLDVVNIGITVGGQRGFVGLFEGTLFLVDGKQVNLLSNNQVPLANNFPASEISRVEVVQGPLSTLYGGNASQGVINVITKVGDSAHGEVNRVEYVRGGAGTEQLSGIAKQRVGDATIGFSAVHSRSERDWSQMARFLASDELYSRDATANPLRYRGEEGFASPEESDTFHAQAGYKGFYLGARYTRLELGTFLVGVPFDYQHFRAQIAHTSLYGGFRRDLPEGFKLVGEYQYYSTRDRQDFGFPTNLDTATDYSDLIFETSNNLTRADRHRLNLRGEHHLGTWNVAMVGYDFWRIGLDSFSAVNATDVVESAETRDPDLAAGGAQAHPVHPGLGTALRSATKSHGRAHVQSPEPRSGFDAGPLFRRLPAHA